MNVPTYYANMSVVYTIDEIDYEILVSFRELSYPRSFISTQTYQTTSILL